MLPILFRMYDNLIRHIPDICIIQFEQIRSNLTTNCIGTPVFILFPWQTYFSSEAHL